MAHAEVSNEEKPSYWEAVLSESECDYRDETGALLPQQRRNMPIRAVTAAVPEVNDGKAVEVFVFLQTIKPLWTMLELTGDAGEQRQAEVCQLSTDCRVVRIPTMHQVQNADPTLVAETIEDMAGRLRPQPHDASAH